MRAKESSGGKSGRRRPYQLFLSRSGTVLSQHFVIFVIITAVANLPTLLLFQGGGTRGPITPEQSPWVFVIGIILSVILTYLAQAVVLHAAFQAMRRKPVSLGE